jgi:hypothetical protein
VRELSTKDQPESDLLEGKILEQSVLYPAIEPSKPLSDVLASAGENIVYHRVGTGRAQDPDSLGIVHCGEIYKAIRCPTLDGEHDLHLLTDNCGRLQCPTCYHSAVSRSAHRAAERIDGMSEAWRANGVELGKLKHIAFSPPQRKWTKAFVSQDQGKSLREEMTRLLRRYFKDGAYGGALVFHGERKRHEDGSECHQARCSEEHHWEWSPHFHYVGYGFLSPSSDTFYQETGWIYKNIHANQERDAYATISYQLSHAGIWLNHDTPKWRQVGTGYFMVGLLSNSKGGRKVLDRSYEPLGCSVCQKALHEFGVSFEQPDWHDDKGEYQRPVVVVEWYINDKSKNKTYLQQTVEGFELDLMHLPKK